MGLALLAGSTVHAQIYYTNSVNTGFTGPTRQRWSVAGFYPRQSGQVARRSAAITNGGYTVTVDANGAVDLGPVLQRGTSVNPLVLSDLNSQTLRSPTVLSLARPRTQARDIECTLAAPGGVFAVTNSTGTGG